MQELVIEKRPTNPDPSGPKSTAKLMENSVSQKVCQTLSLKALLYSIKVFAVPLDPPLKAAV